MLNAIKNNPIWLMLILLITSCSMSIFSFSVCDSKRLLTFKEILSLGELSLSTLIFLTKTLIQIPLNESLSKEFLVKIETLPKSLLSEKKYISYVIFHNSNEMIKANFNLKEAYFHNPAIYDYFKDIFPTIPQLHVFKNMNVN